MIEISWQKPLIRDPMLRSQALPAECRDHGDAAGEVYRAPYPLLRLEKDCTVRAERLRTDDATVRFRRSKNGHRDVLPNFPPVIS